MQPDYPLYQSTAISASEQQKVMRNTWMMLGLTMVPTAIGALIGVETNLLFMAQHPILYTIGMLLVMYGLFTGIAMNRNNSMGVLLLLVATGLLGFMLGPILQVALHMSNGGQLIAMAAGGTGAILITLSTIAMVSKRDFSFLGQFLMVGLVMLILASIANLFFHVPAVSLVISAIAILLFSGYLLYDVSRIVTGGETNYVLATLSIYLDIYNIFVNLLSLLISLSGNDRR